MPNALLLPKAPTLTTLNLTLPHAPKLARVAKQVVLPTKRPNERRLDSLSFSEQYKPYWPFNSSYEVYIWEWLIRFNFQKRHGWQPQITFGRKGARGSTRVDFLSDALMIAWYPDGTYWHVGNGKEAADQLKRAQVKGKGYRVVQWLLDSPEQLVQELPTFYRDMVYRGRNR